MTDEQLADLIRELDARPPTCEIQLGTDLAHGVGDSRAASAGARSRIDSLGRGERTVDVHRNGEPAEKLIATHDQAMKLMRHGAKPAPEDIEAGEHAIDAERNAKP